MVLEWDRNLAGIEVLAKIGGFSNRKMGLKEAVSGFGDRM